MFNVILAMDENNGIGYEGKLPWKCKEELVIFRDKTMEGFLIVGRKTAEKLPALDGRNVIVLTRNNDSLTKLQFNKNKYTVFDSMASAMIATTGCDRYHSDKVFVAGGAEIYNEAFSDWKKLIKNVHLSVMKGKYKCDAYVKFNPSEWTVVERDEYEDFTHYVLKPEVSGECQYLKLLKEVMKDGCVREGRNGNTKSLFGRTMTFDLRKGFPLLTTKKMFWRGVVEELLFFIRGDTDSSKLEEKKINIWKGNTSREFLDSIGKNKRRKGVMGPMYGYQWRNWGAEYDEDTAGAKDKGIDQLVDVVEKIRSDPYSRRILMTDFNPKQAGDGVLYPCFLQDTIILTKNGYKFIQDVQMSDKLMTHTGTFQEINSIQKTIYRKNNIVEIKVSHHPHTIKTTPEHPFYTREVTFLKNKGKNIGKELGEIKWVQAKDLTYKHYIGMKINDMDIIPTMSWDKKVNQFKTKIITKTLGNLDEWFLFGYFLGDGWIEWKRQSLFNLVFCYAHEKMIMGLLQKLDITFSYKKRKIEGKCKTVVCTNFQLWKIFTEFGHKAHNKRIPEWVQNAPVKYIQKFIDGYTMADGSKLENGFQYTTVSKNIAFGMQRLYLKLGKVLKVYYQERKPTTVIMGRTVNQRNTYSLGWIEPQKNSSVYVFDSGYIWYRPSSIDQVVYLDPVTVYNFDVHEDHTYCVENLIVHNCHSVILQFYVDGDNLDMFCYNRSSDSFHGLPFNIASSSLLLVLIAKITNKIPRNFVLSLGDVHVYESHYGVVEEQLKRIPYGFPELKIRKEIKTVEDIEEMEYVDFEICGYESYPTLKVDMIS